MLFAITLICVTLVASPVQPSSVPEINAAVQHNSTRDLLAHPKDVRSTVNPRIIGGETVTPHAYPFQVALEIHATDGTYFCGGSLISNQWVLTAAHCVDMKPNYIIVALGAHNLVDLSDAVLLNATKYKHHPDWDEEKLINDVGLVRLPKNVTFTANIKTVEIVGGSNKYAGETGTTLGWGQTERETLSNVLKKVDSKVMTNDACLAAGPAFQGILTSSHICTSGDSIKGSCSGDSGGPLLIGGKQAGIVSFGYTNCLEGHPSVYTRLTDFHDWILDNAKDNANNLITIHHTAFISLILSVVYFFQ